MDSMIALGGMPLETTYPYDYNNNVSTSTICAGPVDFPSPAQRRINKYNVGDDELIEYVLRSPIGVYISATGWGSYNPTEDNKGFTCKAGVKVNHAVLLIGYTP